MASDVRIADGSFDFSGGIDSGRTTTVQSESNPHGLPRTMLAWLTNATVRGGGILQRTGWYPLIATLHAGALFQGGYLYEPASANPYLIASIGGRIYKALLDDPFTVTDLSAVFGLTNPADVDEAFFEQGEQFLVIQPGDYKIPGATLPLFWDGTTLRRSRGLNASTPGFTPTTYHVTSTVPFLVPALSRTGTLFLAAPYGGTLGDVVTSDVGTFLVTGIFGSTVVLQTIASTFAGTGTVAPGPLTFTTTELRTVYNVSLAADWTIVGVGQSVTLTLTAPYGGSLNDTGTWASQTTGNADATYQVTAIVGNTVTLLTLSLAGGFAGGVWHAADNPFLFLMTPPTTPVPTSELPAAGPMRYYQGRMWYAQGRIFTAGDIVGGPSGTAQYRFKDAILKVTENPLAIGGDGFAVPDNAGDIRGLQYTANLDSSLGQGPLYVGTRKQIYALNVPVTRADWIAAGNNNQPLMTVAQRRYGWVGNRCITPVNGDLFYQTMEPAIRSLQVSIRYFQQWGNTQISSNENRVLAFNNRALMRFASGIEFDNRLWQTVLPVQTPVGVGFQGIVPLDFDLISTLQEKLPPAWEGMYEGLDILQLFEGDFGGLARAFAVVHSRADGSIALWELTNSRKFDKGDNRVTWYFETPAYNWRQDFELKELDGGEIWIDKIAGTVELKVEYRVDADPCWTEWTRTQFCSAKNTCEDASNPVCDYPEVTLCEGYRFPVTLPKPQPAKCLTQNARPNNRGYQFQVRVTVKGWCRVRAILLFALPVQRKPFEGLKC